MAAIAAKQKPPPCDTGEGDHAQHGGRSAMSDIGYLPSESRNRQKHPYRHAYGVPLPRFGGGS